MKDLQPDIDRFFQLGLEQLHQRHEEAVKQVESSLKRFEEVSKGQDDNMAIADWDSDLVKPSRNVIPSLLRYGDLYLMPNANDCGKMKIPLLLPTAVDAVWFDVGAETEQVSNLFTNIILRMLLTMKTNLVKVSIVDMDLGGKYRYVSSLSNPKFQKQIVFEEDGIKKLVSDLGKEVAEANRTFLGKYASIDEYNAQSGQMARPYHFVFIEGFPRGFTQQTIDSLLSLIRVGNALKAGVKIFINYNQNNVVGYRNLDLGQFKRICACIFNRNGHVELENWPLILPPNVIPSLNMALPKETKAFADFLQGIKYEEASFSLDDWAEELISNGKVWQGVATKGISIPVGCIGPSSHFMFELGLSLNKDPNKNDFSALITGRSGSGKSTLSNAIIVNAAMKYSPKELQFFLVDFSPNGSTFNIFETLPHVKALMMADNREYVMRMFQYLMQETEYRSRLFQEAQDEHPDIEVRNMWTYREVTGKKMPRIVLIIDEFQVLFKKDDGNANDIIQEFEITNKARDLLRTAIRGWQKFGISVILVTQSLINVGIPDDVPKEITYRFAMNEEADVSDATIGNNAAKDLPKYHAIMNNSGGDINRNVVFKVADSKIYRQRVEFLAKKYEEVFKTKNVPFLCKRSVVADIAENTELKDILIGNKTDQINNNNCSVYIGKPDLLRNAHTRIVFSRQPNSNTLIIGNDNKTLLYTIMLQLLQLKQQSHPNSKFYIVDCFFWGNEEVKKGLDFLAGYSDSFILKQSEEMDEVVAEVNAELMRRKDAQRERKRVEERMVLVVLNAQDCEALKPVQDRYGMTTKTTTQILSGILAEGPQLGIHCIIHAFSYSSISSLFRSSGFYGIKERFVNRIAMKSADMGNLYSQDDSNPDRSILSKMNMDVEGQVIVDNGRLDNESDKASDKASYEQCKVYSRFTVENNSSITDFVSNFFENYRDVR